MTEKIYDPLFEEHRPRRKGLFLTLALSLGVMGATALFLLSPWSPLLKDIPAPAVQYTEGAQRAPSR